MNCLPKWQKILLRAMSYILVACLASVITYTVFIGQDSQGMQKLQQMEGLIKTYFVGDIKEESLFDAAAEGMVAGLGDRWSYYVSASDMQEYDQQKDNAYVGVGITIQLREDQQGFDILRVEPGGSAKEQGILPGDILWTVEGASVKELDLQEVGARIAGQEGTSVTVSVLRQEQELEFVLTRQKILTEVAKGQLLPGNVGYIRIANFNTNCAEQTIEKVDALLEQGAQALVFDVRYNGGGYVTELVKILDHLLPEGDLFISEDYKGKRQVETSDAGCVQLPMAVLVNESSYSAAEFFAAALREYDWASVVGLPTTGKGYFQQTFDLNDGSAIAISMGKYYTPKGISLAQEGGLTPDVTVQVDENTAAAIYSQTLQPEEDPQLQAAIETVKP